MQWQVLSPKDWKTFSPICRAVHKKTPRTGRAERLVRGGCKRFFPYFQEKSRYMNAENCV